MKIAFEHRSPPTERVFKLVDEISGLTLTEVAELGLTLAEVGKREHDGTTRCRSYETRRCWLSWNGVGNESNNCNQGGEET
ncbi:hypothetical protein L484_014522 [Morus notabilis]|uniref:Uncharacterized protein n=1 Tax=Morus notabilis TaxID=981085 RepID=W9RYV4_9ROSA|nr:hypothetical protein L484_014522 [Morus notabilis]